MSEHVQIILGIVFLVAVFILTRFGVAWKLRSAAGSIIRELESKGAVDVYSAVQLPYSKPNLLRIGMRITTTRPWNILSARERWAGPVQACTISGSRRKQGYRANKVLIGGPMETLRVDDGGVGQYC